MGVVGGGRLTAGGGKVAGRACPAPTGWRKGERVSRHQLPASLPFTQSLHKRYMFPLDVTGWMVYTVGRRTVLSYYILCQFSIRYLIFMKGAFPMLQLGQTGKQRKVGLPRLARHELAHR